MASHPAKAKPDNSRRQRKIDLSITHISQIAWDMFELHGYQQVTMEAIANAADVAKATLYKYFPSKESLLEHHFKLDTQTLRNQLQSELALKTSLRAQLECLFQAEADYLQDKAPYLGALLEHRMRTTRFDQNPATRSQFYQTLLSLITLAQQKGEIRRDSSAEILANYLSFLRSADLFYWLAHPSSSLHAQHHSMLDLFFQGIRC